jgi:hypothetical protein
VADGSFVNSIAQAPFGVPVAGHANSTDTWLPLQGSQGVTDRAALMSATRPVAGASIWQTKLLPTSGTTFSP